MGNKSDVTGLHKAPAFHEVIGVLQKSISIKSLSGKEEEIVKYLVRVASRLGFTDVGTDRMGNLVAGLQVGDGKGPTIVFTGHLDTVNADPQDWAAETRPWAGAVRDGRIYGRGAADMKSSVVCMLHAASTFTQASPEFSGKIYVIGTVVEELFEGICFLEALKDTRPDYIVVGEATGGKVNIGQRGRAEIVITSFGQPKHASTGRKVINAIEQIAYIIDAFHRWYRSDEDNILGRRNIVPTDIQIPIGGGGGLNGRGGNSTVPSRVELTYDIRTLVGDTRESILSLVEENIARVVQNGRSRYPNFKDPSLRFAADACTTWTGIEIEQEKFAPAWKTPTASILVKKAIEGVESTAGYTPEMGHYSFCTDGSASVSYNKLFPKKKVQVIGYGPGDEGDAHTVNESVSLEELQTIYLGFQGICGALLRKA